MNFVNINDDQTVPTINLNKIAIQQEPVRELIVTPVKIALPNEQEEKEGCIQAECPVEVRCSDEYFAIKNLFSELTDDYQRAIIRQNLGINGVDTLIWGKIEGNLANQKDLYNFIKEVLSRDQSGILDSVNLELKYWTQYIENKIESLASNIKSFDIIPKYTTSNQIPVDVLVTWEYDQPADAQAVNGIVIDSNQRNYIFQNIEDSFSIRLQYYYNGVWLSRTTNFEVSFPIFYGTSSNWEDNAYTIQNSVKVNAEEDQYIYIFTKSPSELSVNGIIGGFEQQQSIYIQSTRYYVYKSTNPGLGETTIKIYDIE